MTKIFSIKPIYSEKIYKKEKRVEFRRQNVKIARNEMCLIYTTAPVKKITGYFVVEKKLRLPLNKLWNITKDIGGIPKKVFMNYFKGLKYGTAIIFKFVKNFIESIDAFKFFPGFVAPQSYYRLKINRVQKMARMGYIPNSF